MRRIFLIMICLFGAIISSQAEGEVAFAYQGRVRVQGQPFNGSGQFKFSILDTSGAQTLWSNDGTGAGGAEPTAHLTLGVSDGIFNVIVGDVSLGMQSINGSIFNSKTPLKLRVWFNDGVRGFQQLNPDHTLVNLTLNVLETGNSDFAIYVNGVTGNDRSNGLTPATAKKTIQAAVDSLPDRINCNITIDIANGVYREKVNVHGLSVIDEKKLLFLGDEAWTPASGTPGVQVSGADAGAPTTPVRNTCFIARQCSGISLRGIHFTRANGSGVLAENSDVLVQNCLASHNLGNGFSAGKAKIHFTNCDSSHNDVHGFGVSETSSCDVTSCSATYNGYSGIVALGRSTMRSHTYTTLTNNGRLVASAALLSGGFCEVGFGPSSVTTIKNNTGHGIQAGWHGFIIYTTMGILVNTGNSAGATNTFYGGIIYP